MISIVRLKGRTPVWQTQHDLRSFSLTSSVATCTLRDHTADPLDDTPT